MELKHFLPREFKHYGEMSPELGYMLDDTRRILNDKIIITGSWRRSEDKRTSAHQVSSSGLWEAVDIMCNESQERFLLVSAAYLAGFRRIGLYDRHVHLDVAEEHFDQDVCWLGGKSK